MFKIYQFYIFKKFLLKYLYFNLIFISLIIVMSILEEISFFKNSDENILYPLMLTILNTPNTLFEIIPFIFLLSTQFLFYDLFKSEEIDLLKRNGLKNFGIIKNLFFITILIGFLNILILYNISALMKFHYSNIKNNFSNDNKYLAMVNESGLWIKDNIENENKLITKSQQLKNEFLFDVVISEFDKNYELTRVIKSKKINIKSNEWIIYDPEITIENITDTSFDLIKLKTNFDFKKISSFFSDISTLNLVELFNKKNDYDKLGYSTENISIYILRIFSMPIYCGILVILASVIMFNSNKQRSFIFNLVLGIFISVIIYYINFIFTSIGNSGKIPINISVFFPFILISIISTMGLVGINEK